MRSLIYSAIYGGIDNIIEQPKQTIDTDFVMFSDKYDGIDFKNWQPKVMPVILEDFDKKSPIVKHPRMKAKYWKLHPNHTKELLMKDYDITIWIDGSVKILTNDFVEKCIEWLGDNNMMVFEHPDRDCIYDELDKSLTMKKYEGTKIKDQVEIYRAEGMPEHNGLYACGVIVRKGNTSYFDDKWWQENINRSYQDQLSFAYLCWKLKFYPAIFPLYQYKNKYIDVSLSAGHKELK